MRLAFAIVSLFPWGGLQRVCLRLAREAIDAGHEVTIFTSRTQGDAHAGIPVSVLPVHALTNHGRNRAFGEALAQAVLGRFDRLVGFDKLPGLDIYLCGDLCFADRPFGFWSRFHPRVRTMLELEGACFSPAARTRVLVLTEAQREAYLRAWGTQPDRIEVLPPTIETQRRHPEYRTDGTRERMRAELGLGADEIAVLCVGAWAERKGFDRAVDALRAEPAWRLLVCGIEPNSRDGGMLLARARRAGAADRVHLLGPRADLIELMAASDLLAHPARAETTGTVILEAVINGLPAVVTEVCGFAPHVRTAAAGIVVGEPFRQVEFEQALRVAADSARRATWSANGAGYGADPVLYSGFDRALKAICGAK
jgi:UDP-glucose:(heptosyl)LPS alpha-1,3-glucosyltransferase